MGNLRKIRKGVEANQEAPTPESQGPQDQSPVKDAQALVEGGKVNPALQEKMESYVTTLMHLMHAPETSDNVMEMLSGGPAEQSIPFAANQINSQVEASLKNNGVKKIDDAVKIAGAMYLVSDLAELGNSAGVFEIQQDQLGPILQKTMQDYIHQGLRDKTIDPVQLQLDTEPLLNKQQNKAGVAIQSELGLPSSPTTQMGIQKVVGDKTAPLEQENAELKQQMGQLNRDQRVHQQQMANTAQQQGGRI